MRTGIAYFWIGKMRFELLGMKVHERHTKIRENRNTIIKTAKPVVAHFRVK
jgi:hypothetical protein